MPALEGLRQRPPVPDALEAVLQCARDEHHAIERVPFDSFAIENCIQIVIELEPVNEFADILVVHHLKFLLRNVDYRRLMK